MTTLSDMYLDRHLQLWENVPGSLPKSLVTTYNVMTTLYVNVVSTKPQLCNNDATT